MRTGSSIAFPCFPQYHMLCG